MRRHAMHPIVMWFGDRRTENDELWSPDKLWRVLLLGGERGQG